MTLEDFIFKYADLFDKESNLDNIAVKQEWESYEKNYIDKCDFVKFDEFLEKICPNITILQYKKLCREIISNHEHHLFYRNIFCYEKRVYINDLYEKLNEIKLI